MTQPAPLSSTRRRQAVPEFHSGVSALKRITKMTLGYRKEVAIAVVATVIAAGFQLLIPRLLGNAVDLAHGLMEGGLITATDFESGLWITALALLGASIVRGVFTMLHNYYGDAIGHKIGYDLRLAYYEKLQRLSFSFHDRVHTGDLITRGMLDLEGVRMFPNTGLLRIVLLAVLVGVGAYLLISSDLVLGLLALSFVPFVAWRSAATQMKLRATWLDLQERLSVMTRHMDENLGGIRVVRAFAAQDHEMGKFDVTSKAALDLSFERVGIRVRNTSIMTFSFFLAMGLVLWVGGGKVIAGEITVGKLAEFLTFMTILQMPVRQLGMMVNSFARASTCGTRVFEVLDLPVEIDDKPGARDLEITGGKLKFEDVEFRYAGHENRRAVSGISFEAGPGQTIGIVGPPGSGKSTIAHLVPRFYDVTGGRITIDGQDIRDVSLASLRRAVGVVQQDSFLFTTTIENNIAYGDPWAHDKRIERASESAQLHNYIVGLPKGYDTLVGERGVSLSGGQRQRLSIARSLVTRPSIMVLDDSTAAIDAATEQRIRAAIKEMAKDRVTLIISHRLSSLMHATEILFIEDGRIVERGTHEQLLRLGGRYKALYDLQLRPEDQIGAA